MFLRLREYHRPTTLDEALALLARSAPATRALAGGTSLCGGVDDETEAVADLTSLGLDSIASGAVGAMASLQAIADATLLPTCLREAALASAPRTVRVAATLGGTLRAPDGGIAVPTALRALGATIHERGPLITGVSFADPARSSFMKAARTPSDAPTVCAVAVLTEGNTVRVALGGMTANGLTEENGIAPSRETADVLAVDARFDGSESAVWRYLEASLGDALSRAPATGDWLANAAYREEVGRVLARRAVAALFGR